MVNVCKLICGESRVISKMSSIKFKTRTIKEPVYKLVSIIKSEKAEKIPPQVKPLFFFGLPAGWLTRQNLIISQMKWCLCQIHMFT
jgi:hypothetical protein